MQWFDMKMKAMNIYSILRIQNIHIESTNAFLHVSRYIPSKSSIKNLMNF